MLLINLSQFLIGHGIIEDNGLELCERLVHGFGKRLVGSKRHLVVSGDRHFFTGVHVDALAGLHLGNLKSTHALYLDVFTVNQRL